MAAFLAEHHLPDIVNELRRLEGSARDALGDAQADYEIKQSALLRRQIARRCIYGIDLNPTAVELARVAMWIHTFVPGLPMSSLNHTLVCANSLTGVGTIDEALESLEPDRKAGTPSLFSMEIEQALEDARRVLVDAANTSEATRAEVRQAVEAAAEAGRRAAPTRLLFDAAVALQAGFLPPNVGLRPPELQELVQHPEVRALVEALQPAHMPFLFPEVFLRTDPGFDVLIGNPPWDKVRHEPQQFWVTRDPGLNTLRDVDRTTRIEELRSTRVTDAAIEREESAQRQTFQIIARSMFDLQGTGHYDFAKLFAERNLKLIRKGGSVGLVLPFALLVLGGSAPIRRFMVKRGTIEVVQCRNTGEWLFEGADNRKVVALMSYRRSSSPGVSIVPEINSYDEFQRRHSQFEIWLSVADLRGISDKLTVPRFSSPAGAHLFKRLLKRPRLGAGDGWIEGHADTRWDFSGSGRHRDLAGTDQAAGSWAVLMARHVNPYSISTSGFRKWVAEPRRLVTARPGVEVAGDKVRLASDHPIICYRFASTNNNSRTLIATALHETGFVYSTGYAHGIAHPPGTPINDILALLSVLNSPLVDWWARRLVDRHVGAGIISSLPLPDWNRATRREASSLASSLLLKRGTVRLPGGQNVQPLASEEGDAIDTLARIDALVAIGFDLSWEDVEGLLGDFRVSRAAVSAEYRSALARALKEAV